MESDEYSGAEEAESYTWIDSVLLPSQQKKRKKGRDENKRRFSEEQIKSLETMFESQAKLEPRKKLQLARELGLQPRQVAIWFQNKRARWKSKQLEREYAALKADYDALLSEFESLKQEKQHLIKQLQRLAELLNKELDDAGKRQASCVSSGEEDLLLLTDEVPTSSSCLGLDGNGPCSPEKRAAAGSDWWEYHWLTD